MPQKTFLVITKSSFQFFLLLSHEQLSQASRLFGQLDSSNIPPAGRNKYHSKTTFQYLKLTSCLLSTIIKQPFIAAQRVHEGCKTLWRKSMQLIIRQQHVQTLIVSIQWERLPIRGHWRYIVHSWFSSGHIDTLMLELKRNVTSLFVVATDHSSQW